MPTKSEIAQKVLNAKNGAQDEIRRAYLKDLSDYTQRDTLLYCSAYTTPQANGVPSDALSLVTGDTQGVMSSLHGLRNHNLDLIIHSPGGSSEAVEQISHLTSDFLHQIPLPSSLL